MMKQVPRRCGLPWPVPVYAGLLLVGVGAFASFAGCSPTFAPPSRVAIGVMPELDESGRGNVRLQGGHRGTVALRVEGGIAPGMTLEAGVSGSTDQDGMAMVGFGVRHALYGNARGSVVGVGGVAVGCGGKIDGSGGCNSRFAWGGYMGLDLGYRVGPWLGFYQGSRWQWSVGQGGRPLTLWQIYALGGQLGYDPVYLSLEIGYARYDSFMDDLRQAVDSGDGPHVSLGVGARW